MRVFAPIDLTFELRKIPLFAELPQHQYVELAARAHSIRIERDKPIIAEGTSPTGVPVLLHGLVKVSMGRVLVDILRAPCFAFVIGAIEGGPSPVSVIAMRPCEVVVLDRGAVMAAVIANPGAAQKLAEATAREARAILRRVPELVGGSVEERLMLLLDRLSERHGSPLDDGRYMALPLRRCDIAMMLAATTETVSRLLAEWERRGWFRSNRAGLWWGSRSVRDGVSSVPPPCIKSDRPQV